MTERVIVLVDMDCFYCQVETKLNPALTDKPVAVVQYNAWKGGGIIAVNYEARDKGVTRSMRGDDAKARCPDIELVSVPTIRNKADLSKYRDASRDVIAVLCTFSDCVERASIDEAYLDLTESVKTKQTNNIKSIQISNTFVVGYSKEKCNDEAERESGTSEWLNDIYSNELYNEASKNLAIAASIVEEIRAEVFSKTGFRCSAGIAHNKILAKLACGLHKPNRQTVLPHSSVPHLYKTLSVKKVRHLGGKLGDMVMEKLNCNVMADLFQYSEKELKMIFDEKTGSWLYNMARGIDNEQVQARLVPKSIGCCKRFPGKTALKSKADITYWLTQLTEELIERTLEDQSMNKRKAQLLTVSMTLPGHQATSKAIPLSAYDHDKIYNSSYLAIRKICSNSKEDSWTPIYCLGLSASKFSDLPTSGAIYSYFQANPSKSTLSSSKCNKKGGSASITTSETKVLTGSFFSKFIKNTDGISTPASSNSCDNQDTINIKDSSHWASDIDEKSNDAGSSRFYNNLDSSSEKNIFSPAPIKNNNSETVETPLEKTNKPKNNIKRFFSKQVNSLAEIKTEDLAKTASSSIAKEKDNSIEAFFKNKNEYEVINPLDVFPDLSIIDDEMLQSFPISFRRKVLALKKESLNVQDPNISNNSKVKNVCADSKMLFEKVPAKDSFNEKKVDPTNNKGNELLCKATKDWDCSDMFEDSNEETFVNTEPTGQTSKYFPSNNLETCPECGENFDNNDLPEHLDFHVAQRISMEINSVQMSSASTLPVRQSNVSLPAKRKQSGRGKKISDSNSKKFKTLKTFFGS